ncbi:hypothetical protein K458DRAFT_478149 [Lentithecium fluviatile CBS 122367]|uniref:Cytochrome b561 domain-containing protein n=1 Tax=Lentithecium fluviatile CBS 122367 TaxID=1168545 RepID=A0A6G1J0R3_9PLEO|nr:hypothetical protein K458DRAFT_478149 [Lentithecium fluviatile CBS 122367]
MPSIMFSRLSAVLLSLASMVSAHYGHGGQYGSGAWGGYGPYGGGGSSSNNAFANGQFGSAFASGRNTILVAHGVLAALAFVIFFPMGSILIRLASFRGAWIVHGLFQVFAYLVYTAAFGIGIYIVQNVPINLLDHYHPIIGIVVFVLLFFQPILGLIHHFQFQKNHRRTFWSYGHLWLGRIVITLGIINGGLGLLFATETGFFAPSRDQIIAYGVVAGIMWLLWVAAIVVGGRRRARANKVVRSDASYSSYTASETSSKRRYV